jgi:hypothetical protein
MRWRLANPERSAELKRKHHWKLRYDALMAYGGLKCKVCGFDDIRALQLDHIKGNGSKQAKELKGKGWTLYRWLKKNSYPPGYQVLCANHNWIKRAENKEYGEYYYAESAV